MPLCGVASKQDKNQRMDARSLLRDLFEASVCSAQPQAAISAVVPFLTGSNPSSVLVVGAGKASAQMARALESVWPVYGPALGGMVVTRYGHGAACQHFKVLEAAHPVPDSTSVSAASETLNLVGEAPEDGLIVCLLSGGGSSLLCGLPGGVRLEEMQSLTRELLACGASIAETNCVRRHVSQISGGRLAAAAPSRIVTLAISDVYGDAPSDICSGPTVGDPTTRQEALKIIEDYRLCPSPSVLNWLSKDASESLKPGDPKLSRSEFRVLISPRTALDASAQRAQALGIDSKILGYDWSGESKLVAAEHAKIVLDILSERTPGTKPIVLLSGGETTVKVKGPGRGGRNTEFIAALAQGLQGIPGVYALAADTDGIDGNMDIAGAFMDSTTASRARDMGFSIESVLENNVSHSMFQALGDSLITGPTGTNVNDFRAVLIT